MSDGYLLVTDRDEYAEVVDWIRGIDTAAIDFEGWTIVRLVQICNDDDWIVIDFGPKGDNWFAEVADDFDQGQAWIAFNSIHEKTCFRDHGEVQPTVWDVGHLRRAIEGGGHMSLKQLVARELDVEMDKTEQASDWDTGGLTDSQLDYAADDALLTWRAWRSLRERAAPGHMRAFNMLDSMTDAVIEMQETGLLLHQERHVALTQQWVDLRDAREAELRKLITEDEVENLNSGKQLSNFFSSIVPDEVLGIWERTEKTGLLSMKNRDLLDMAGAFGDTPLGSALRLLAERSTLEKYIGTFGYPLINRAKMAKDGRIHARYNIGAAITGRFSSSAPNLQQVPRDRDFFGERLSVRRSFISEPGRVLVSLDYSGIELRVLALLSGDAQLIYDAIHGDVHSAIGEYVAGRPLNPKESVEDKELRQSMKAVNFGIVYGTTPLGLAGRQGWSFDYANDLLIYWAKRYSDAFKLRSQMQKEAQQTGYLPMVDGGQIYVGKKAGKTVCANYPVQRAALSVMAYAITRFHDRVLDLRDSGVDVRLASTIHDALIADAAEAHAPKVLRAMEEAMTEGYLDVFPGAATERLVEGGFGPSWGELE